MQQIAGLADNRRTPTDGDTDHLVRVDRPGAQATPCLCPPEHDQESPFRRRILKAASVTRWQVAAELTPELFDDRGLRIQQWQESGQVDIVKSGRHRTVYRITLPCGNFYLKHYKTAGPRDLLQNVVRPCRAQLECRAADEVAHAGVPTVEPVALGMTRVGPFIADSFLMCREIERTQPLDHFVIERLRTTPAGRTAGIRSAVALKLGRLTADLHRAGLIHRDFHAGNILIRTGSDNAVQVWLIDLHSVSRCRFLSRARIESNLALLNNFFVKHASATDRHRFFRAYWDAFHANDSGESSSDSLASAFPAALRRLQRVFQHTVAQAYRTGDRKWQRGNRRLIIADTNTAQCRGLARLGPDLIARIRDDPASVLPESQHSPGAASAGISRQSTVALPTLRGITPATVSTFDAPSTGISSKRPGQSGSRARHAWEAGHALLRRGIDVAEPLVFVEPSSLESFRPFLLSQVPPHATTLRACLSRSLDELTEPQRERWMQRTGKKLARQLRRMNALGFSHLGLSSESILVSERLDSNDLWLTDLDDVQRFRWPSLNRSAESLFRLNQSLLADERIRNTLRLRFLKHYLGPTFARDWKRLWRSVESRSHFDQSLRIDQNRTGRQIRTRSKAA